MRSTGNKILWLGRIIGDDDSYRVAKRHDRNIPVAACSLSREIPRERPRTERSGSSNAIHLPLRHLDTHTHPNVGACNTHQHTIVSYQDERNPLTGFYEKCCLIDFRSFSKIPPCAFYCYRSVQQVVIIQPCALVLSI